MSGQKLLRLVQRARPSPAHRMDLSNCIISIQIQSFPSHNIIKFVATLIIPKLRRFQRRKAHRMPVP